MLGPQERYSLPDADFAQSSTIGARPVQSPAPRFFPPTCNGSSPLSQLGFSELSNGEGQPGAGGSVAVRDPAQSCGSGAGLWTGRQLELGSFKEELGKSIRNWESAGSQSTVPLPATGAAVAVQGSRKLLCASPADDSIPVTFLRRGLDSRGREVAVQKLNFRTGFCDGGSGAVAVPFSGFTGLNLLLEMELSYPPAWAGFCSLNGPGPG